MKTQSTPCDYGKCPYDAIGGMDCRNYCGLGVDEDSYDEEDFDYSEYEQNMPCDTYGMCAGTSCKRYFECQGGK